MLLVWDRAASAGPVGGYDRVEFARYFTSGLVVRQLTAAWIVWELNNQIRMGQLSPALLKPIHPLAFRVAENLVALPFRVVVLVPLVVGLWLWRPEMGIGLALRDVPLLCFSIAVAWAMNFAAQVAFGSLAFFLQSSLGVFDVWFALWALLSGYLFPLSLLPEPYASIVHVLPFRGMLAVPVEIGAGQLTGTDALAAVGLQVAWCAVLMLAGRALWNAGVRRYEAYGA